MSYVEEAATRATIEVPTAYIPEGFLYRDKFKLATYMSVTVFGQGTRVYGQEDSRNTVSSTQGNTSAAQGRQVMIAEWVEG